MILAFQMRRMSASSLFVLYSDLHDWRQTLHDILSDDSFFIDVIVELIIIYVERGGGGSEDEGRKAF